MFVSVIVSTYGRIESFKALVESIRQEFSSVEYEVVAVSSDEIDSPKLDWIRSQGDIVLVACNDRPPGSKRSKSLYYYENLGLSHASGEWTLITNDDSIIDPGTLAGIQLNRGADILVAPTEIDNPKLGKRTPVIGRVQVGAEFEDIYLLDFAFFSRRSLEIIGPADTEFDWYGRGADMGVRAALLSLKVEKLALGGITHSLDLENSLPPHPSFDFSYLERKWAEHQVEWFGPSLSRGEGSIYVRFVWPFVQVLRNQFRRISRTKAR